MRPQQRAAWTAFMLGVCTILTAVGLSGLALMELSASCRSRAHAPAASAPAVTQEDRTVRLVGTTPSSMVRIDGMDTGKWTPVPRFKAIPIAPGPHDITFQTKDDTRYLYRVVLEKGENKVVIPELGKEPRPGFAFVRMLPAAALE